MALRGPDGSMMTATDGLYDERNSVFYVFGVGLACTVGSVVLCVWLILSWESALVCMGVTIMTCRRIYRNYVRVVDRFDYDENETVDFTDIFEGPAAIRAVSVPYREVLRRKKKGDSGELRIDTRRIDTRQVQRQNPNSLPSSDSDDEVQGLHCVRATRRRQPVARNSPSASGSIDLQTV